MWCERCHNSDKRYFVYHQNKYLCRKCIMFSEGLKESDFVYFRDTLDAEYVLTFKLSKQQLILSKQLNELVKAKHDVLIYAACGSGKTEIILLMIKEALSQGLRVAIAIPRRQVVLELAARLKEYFKHLKVIAVCEGYTKVLFADLIVCTTHQLYHYYQYFDVLVIDEPDAFPFSNNQLLINIQKQSVVGSTVYLTATPTEEMLQLKTLTLFERFHGHKLPIPKVVVGFKFYLFFRLFEFLKYHSKVLLFVPTIKQAETLSKFLRYPTIHSKTKDKESLLKAFVNDEFNVLITTTIMERGITIEGVNVCVLFCDHNVFDVASLIQIAGRVGRKASNPDGEVLFLARQKSSKVKKCLMTLEMMNA